MKPLLISALLSLVQPDAEESVNITTTPRSSRTKPMGFVEQTLRDVFQIEPKNCCELGCFDVTEEYIDLFKRPINPVPDCSVQPTFYLRTLDNVEEPETLDVNSITKTTKSSFHKNREGTKILIHGFVDSVKGTWMETMEKKLLIHGNYNVITMDWKTKSMFTYFQAAADARVHGAVVAKLIEKLTKVLGENPNKIHLIGHSLGAHIAGYASKITRVGRITGLDPAGWYFADMPPSTRLDLTDADLVETVITDGQATSSMSLGYGALHALGHINFYPNGGRFQPGCGDSVLSTLLNVKKANVLGCSHQRATDLFLETIANPGGGILGVECGSWESFKMGACFACGGDACMKMGMGLDESAIAANRSGPRLYFFATGSTPPFSQRHYRVTLTIGQLASSPSKVNFKARLHGTNSSTEWMKFYEEHIPLTSGQILSAVVASSSVTGEVKSVELQWSRESSLLRILDVFWTAKLELDDTLELSTLDGRSKTYQAETAELPESKGVLFEAL